MELPPIKGSRWFSHIDPTECCINPVALQTTGLELQFPFIKSLHLLTRLSFCTHPPLCGLLNNENPPGSDNRSSVTYIRITIYQGGK